MSSFLFFLPIIILISGFFLPKTHIRASAILSLISAIIISFAYWDLSPVIVGSGILKGVFVSLDIVLIIFGALTFLFLMQHLGIISSLEHHLHSLSSDIRVQTILLAWFFGSFLEATAGFGIPALIVSHLLVKIGLPAVSAVVIGLVANSASVTFGAVGTPIKIGFFNFNTNLISQLTVIFGFFIGIFIPVFVLALLTRFLKKPFSYFLEGLPFAVWAGFCFSLPYYVGLSLGIEFPSLIGSILGMMLIYLTIKAGFSIRNVHKVKEVQKLEKRFSLKKVFVPYFLLVAFLLLAKISPIGFFLVNLPNNLSHNIHFLNAGTIFILVSFIILFSHKAPVKEIHLIFKDVFKKIPYPAFIILLIVSTMQVLIAGGQAEPIFSNLKTGFLPLISPFIGAFGAFIAGSATVSNLLFGNLLAVSAKGNGFDVALILSLQLLGATAGNMMSIPNIIAAESAVGLKGEEREIIKKIFPWALLYLFIVIIVGITLLE